MKEQRKKNKANNCLTRLNLLELEPVKPNLKPHGPYVLLHLCPKIIVSERLVLRALYHTPFRWENEVAD